MQKKIYLTQWKRQLILTFLSKKYKNTLCLNEKKQIVININLQNKSKLYNYEK